jgi:hypothetical protein
MIASDAEDEERIKDAVSDTTVLTRVIGAGKKTFFTLQSNRAANQSFNISMCGMSSSRYISLV